MYPFFCPEVVVFVVLSVVKCVVEAWRHDFSPGPHFFKGQGRIRFLPRDGSAVSFSATARIP